MATLTKEERAAVDAKRRQQAHAQRMKNVADYLGDDPLAAPLRRKADELLSKIGK